LPSTKIRLPWLLLVVLGALDKRTHQSNKIFIRYCCALLFDIINKTHRSVNKARKTCSSWGISVAVVAVVAVVILWLLLLTYLRHKVLTNRQTNSYKHTSRVSTRLRVGVPKFNAFVPEEMRKYGKIREKQKKMLGKQNRPKTRNQVKNA